MVTAVLLAVKELTSPIRFNDAAIVHLGGEGLRPLCPRGLIAEKGKPSALANTTGKSLRVGSSFPRRRRHCRMQGLGFRVLGVGFRVVRLILKSILSRKTSPSAWCQQIN